MLPKNISVKRNSAEVLKKCIRSCFTQTDEEYQYMQRSAVPTMHFQKSLPRLPIPPLEDTCARFLKSLQPLLSNEEFKMADEATTQFVNNQGSRLQELLVNQDRNNKHTSYISKPWFKMYLSDRTPLPINYNPCLIFTNDAKPEYNGQLIRSANLIVSSLRFYRSLANNLLKPEVFHIDPKKSDNFLFWTLTGVLPSSISWYGAYLMKAYPLDMSQYSNLFKSSRIPEVNKDRITRYERGHHIVVLRKGHMYYFNALTPAGDIISPTRVASYLNWILHSQIEPAEYPLGILTTADRDDWARWREHLLALGNGEALETIDSSLFVVALDDETDTEPQSLVKQYLHSDGNNRWFDKSFTLIVSASGAAGVNFEHSWGDGVAVLRYCQDIHKDSATIPRLHPNDLANVPLAQPKKIEFKLDDEMKTIVRKSQEKFQAQCDSLQVSCVTYQGLGKRSCKKFDFSADAVMQLAFQLAYQKLYHRQVATYESCSTAAFKHGRTETIRPCTAETKAFCLAASDYKYADHNDLRAMISGCSMVHSELVKKAAMGKGFDRHLFALKNLAQEMEQDVDFFSQPAYKTINYNILSTSTLSSDVILAGGFGPVVKDGFGIGYMIRQDECGAIVTNYSQHTDGEAFKSKLEESFQLLENILTI